MIARTSTHVVFARASRFPLGRKALEVRHVVPHPIRTTTGWILADPAPAA